MKGIALLVVGGIAALVLFGMFGGIITKVQAPVEVHLTSFLVLRGYYVSVMNASSTDTLTSVTVTYTSISGNTVAQRIGALAPRQAKVLDPSEMNWTVERSESISVSADGYLTLTLKTSPLIEQCK